MRFQVRSISFVSMVIQCLIFGLFQDLILNSSSFQFGPSLYKTSRNSMSWTRKNSVNCNKYDMKNQILHLSGTDNNNDQSSKSGIHAELTIEYCTGCRWLLRSTWLMQELFTTFDTEMTSITLIPSKPPSPGGTFEIKLNEETIWDRKIDNGFPEAKELKQRVRNKIAPEKSLGHSDSTSSQALNEDKSQGKNDCVECEEISKEANIKQNALEVKVDSFNSKGSTNNVKITYCTGCRWMLRSAWMCQELLTTFESELNSVTLVPGYDSAGTFHIHIDDKKVWDRKVDNGFPDVKTLKKRVRDIVDPNRSLGHVDDSAIGDDNDTLSDDDAEDLRRFYGVM